jgi:hypothetical protein
MLHFAFSIIVLDLLTLTCYAQLKFILVAHTKKAEEIFLRPVNVTPPSCHIIDTEWLRIAFQHAT